MNFSNALKSRTARWAVLLALIFGIALAVRACMSYYGNWGNWSECRLSRAFSTESGMSHYTSSDFLHIYNRELLRQSPRWTPDGAHIVFTTRSDLYSESRSRSQVHVVAADGSSLLTIGEESDIFHSPIVSSDGSRIMYSAYNDVDEDKRYFEIVNAALDGSEQKRLTHEVGFDVPSDWLDNDTRIAFTRDAESPCAHDPADIGLYTMRPDGSDVRKVIPGKEWGVSGRDILTGTISWAPDRRTVALIIDETLHGRDPSVAITRSKRASLVTVDVSDSSMTRLVVGEERPLGVTNRKSRSLVGPLVWSPDGSRITFLRRQGQPVRLKLYSVNRDGSDLREVVGPDADYARLGGRWVSWSPYFTGPQIMFSPSELLYLVQWEGSGVHSVATWITTLPSTYPSWSPDGSSIAVLVADEKSDVALYTVSPDGSGVRVLARRSAKGLVEVAGPGQRHSAETVCSSAVVIPDLESNPGLVRDCEALVEMMDRLAVVGLNWNAETPISEWEGITLGETTREGYSSETSTSLRVHSLSLPGRDMVGPLPRAVAELSELRVLDLTDDRSRYRYTPYLVGPIPPELGELANLRELNLAGRFDGPIPPELGNLTALESLDLGRSGLFGPIPPELGNLTALKQLSLRDNYFSGSIPPELGNLRSLETLYLDRSHGLSGCIPDGLRGKVTGYEEPEGCGG